MTSVLIIGNARQENLSKWSKLIENSDLIIACDGALDSCLENNLDVDVVIGDMDSISESALEYTKLNSTQVVHVAEQNSNDLSKAISYAKTLQPETVNIIGVDGGDSDHQFANYLTLIETQTNAIIHLDDSLVFCVGSSAPIHYSIDLGTPFSVFSIGRSERWWQVGAQW
jgi:thiamine pyrophosphokinase